MTKYKFRDVSIAAGIVIAYVVCGKFGLLFAYAQPNATAIWAPTGIAIAALLLLGYRFWPAVFIGAFITNFLTPGTPIVATLLIACGNTLEAVAAVYLAHKFANGARAFDKALDVLKFSFFAGIVSTMISPLIGVTALSLSGVSPWQNYAFIWITWWMGDVGGALLVAPLLILWFKDNRMKWDKFKILEGALLYSTVAFFAWTVIINHFVFLFIFLTPLFIWAIFRFDRRTLATILFVITESYVIDVIRLTNTSGAVVNQTLIWVEIFMGINFIAMMTLGASQEEHKIVASDALYRASHDALTGLLNRHELERQLGNEFTKRVDQKNSMALLCLDIDRFKQVNDIFGHHMGDLLLKEFAQRIQACLRPEDFCARLGGDEFVILLSEVNGTADVTLIAKNILKALEPPVTLQDRTVFLTASIGIAMFPDQGRDIWTLLANSDLALLKAKRSGRNHFALYTPGMNERTASELKTAHELREAMSAHQIEPYYQPVIDLHSGAIMNVEALLRWKHPTRGIIPASEFVAIAENFGIMRTLRQQTLNSVFGHQGDWQKHGVHPLRVALNLSSLEFVDVDFTSTLNDLRSQHGPSMLLEIEILENFAMENMDIAKERLDTFQKLGITVCIDDFGTGYSSLSYLKSLPINKLKVDQSFVAACTTNPQDRAIVKAVIDLGHTLQMKVIAEGIETEEQFELLKSLGCDGAQGYYIAKAMPSAELPDWIKKFNDSRLKKDITSPTLGDTTATRT